MRLRIVSVNDVYSLENLPRLKTLIDREREEAGGALVAVLAGDFVAPSILSSLDYGRGMVDCMNAIGIDLVTFGNHEDDVPVEELRARAAELEATWLATNVRGLSLPTSKVIAVGGERVGFVGVVMDDKMVYRRDPFGGGGVEPPNAAAMREAARLVAEERCACVIPITHQPAGDDRALARAQRTPPFPVILGGHEHEPMLEEIDGTWIVKAGSDATHAVVVDVDLATGRAKVRLEAVASHREDAAVRAVVDRHMARVRELEQATLLKLAPGQRLSSIGTRTRQTTMGTLVCSLLRDALHAEACLFNGGGIRGSREYTDRFTYGDLKAEVPFDNEVVVALLPGSVVRDAVKASRSRAPAESAGFLQVDDRTATVSDEVTLLAGSPIDPARDYRVALVRNLFDGLDHIEPLVRFAKERPDRVPPPDSGRDVKVVLVDAFSMALWKLLGGFEAVDANHDGVVTPAEVASAVARVTAEAPSLITVNLVVQALDKNDDDLVTRAEADEAS